MLQCLAYFHYYSITSRVLLVVLCKDCAICVCDLNNRGVKAHALLNREHCDIERAVEEKARTFANEDKISATPSFDGIKPCIKQCLFLALHFIHVYFSALLHLITIP
jgi:hypothetical protein